MLGNIWFYMWLLVVVLVIADMIIGVRKANELLKGVKCNCTKDNELHIMAVDQSAINDRVTDLENARDATNMIERNKSPFDKLLDGPYKPSKADKKVKKIVGNIVNNLKQFAKIAEKEIKKDKK